MACEIGIAPRQGKQNPGQGLGQQQQQQQQQGGSGQGLAPELGQDGRPTKRGYLVYLNPELANVLPEDNNHHHNHEEPDGGSGSGSVSVNLGGGGNGNGKIGGINSRGGGSLGGGFVNDDSSFNLYGIPQTLYKLNADFDTLINGRYLIHSLVLGT